MSITITIPDSVIASAQVTEDELKQEIAIALFQQERLTLSEASDLANMTRLNFQKLLGSRHIPIYDAPDFEKNIENSEAQPAFEFPEDLIGSLDSRKNPAHTSERISKQSRTTKSQTSSLINEEHNSKGSSVRSDDAEKKPLSELLSDVVGSVNSQEKKPRKKKKDPYGDALAEKFAKQGI